MDDPERAVGGAVPDVLERLAATNSDWADVKTIAGHVGCSQDFVMGVISALQPFGVLEFRVDDESVRPVSQIAGDALRSVAASARSEITLIDDWDRLGAADCRSADDLFERGARLLYRLESIRNKKGDDAPLARVSVSKAIITGLSQTGDRLYLMLWKEQSQRFQFIGGAARRNESFETAMRRELIEELPETDLSSGDYQFRMLLDGPVFELFVSPTYGRLTEYEVQYFHVSLSELPHLSQGHRWVTHDELLESVTRDGRKIVPDRTNLPFDGNALKALPLSLAHRVDYKPPFAVESNRPTRDDQPQLLRLTLIFGVLLLITAAVLVGASRLAANAAIVAAILVIVIVGAAFVARGAGWISGAQVTDLFKHALGRGSGSDPAD